MIDLVQQGLKSQDIDYTYIVGRVASTGDRYQMIKIVILSSNWYLYCMSNLLVILWIFR